MTKEIKVGDKVRSFDFDFREITGENACFVEGIVEGIGPGRYKIKTTKRIFGGENKADYKEYYYPPKNGTPSFWGYADFVTKI
jgi:hypothetical protein